MSVGICMLLPALVLMFMREKVLGGQVSCAFNKDFKAFIKEYLISVCFLNTIVIAIAYLIFHHDGPIDKTILSSARFAFKYLALSLLIAFVEPYIENAIRFHMDVEVGEQLEVCTSKKTFAQGISENKTCIIKIAALVLLFFGVNSYICFATDTYATFANGFGFSAKDMLVRNGRPVIALMYYIHYLTGLSNESFYYVSTVLALIFLALSIWLFLKLLSKYRISENVGILLSFGAIANIYIIEYFMFIEKSGFMLAIFFNILAVYLMDDFFETRKIKNLIFSVLSVILAIFTYQGTVALFVILSIPFAYKNSKKLKDYFLNILAIGGAYLISIVIDMILLKFILKSSRIHQFDLVKNLKNFINGLRWISKTSLGILPENLFLILTIIVFIVAIIVALSSKRKIIGVVNVLIITFAACIFPAATILQGSGYWAKRVIYPIASLLAVLVVNIFLNSDKPNIQGLKEKILKLIPICVLGIVLVFQFFSFNKIYIDKYNLKAIDEFRCQCIGQAIKEYEESSDVKITKIAFYKDAATSRNQYSHLYPYGSAVESSFLTSWSDVRAVNYYLHENYEKVEQSEKYTKYFAQKNWNTFSKEQLVFDNDTLHICIY